MPDGDPMFGDAYDIVGIFFTHEGKVRGQDTEPICTKACWWVTQYRPVVVILKSVKMGSNTYSGNLYITRNGVELA